MVGLDARNVSGRMIMKRKTEAIYPNRKALLEYLSEEAREYLDKAHTSKESRVEFCEVLTKMILAE